MQCEAAIVTSGCSAALTHATSACVAGGDPELIQQLPDLTGLKDEVVMLHRYTYDHAIRTLGVKLTAVTTREEFLNALSHRTAMVALTAHGASGRAFPLEEIVAAAHERDIPVLVDAAASYPRSPDPYLARGTDLVTYSGGKLYRGPQCTGFLFGRKDLVDAAWLEQFAASFVRTGDEGRQGRGHGSARRRRSVLCAPGPRQGNRDVERLVGPHRETDRAGPRRLDEAGGAPPGE